MQVPVAELHQLVKSLGFTGVRALLSGGNLVVTTRVSAVHCAADRIQKAIFYSLSSPARLTVFAAADQMPLADSERSPA